MRRIFLILVTMALVVAACGDSGGEDATTTAPPPTDTTAPSTTVAPDTTAGPTATVLPTTITAPPTTATTTTEPPVENIEIDVESTDVAGVVDGTFTTQGSVVDAGLVCPGGSYSMNDFDSDMESQTASWMGVYVCDDESGSFTLDVTTRFTPGETLYHLGEWSVLGGTGNYLGLSGSGSVLVECVDPSSPKCHTDNDGYVERPPGLGVEIDVEDDDGDDNGTFTTKGPAVELGIVCPAGTWSMTDYEPNVVRGTAKWKGVYVCTDGTGSFTLDVATDLGTDQETLYLGGDWTVFEGTGTYVGLTGSGTTLIACVDRDNPSCHTDNDGYLELTG